MAAAVLAEPLPEQWLEARLGHARADQPADQRMRTARRDAEISGDRCHEIAPDQGAEDHLIGDYIRRDDPLPTVLATFRPKTRKATKLKNAAQANGIARRQHAR